MKRIQHYKPLLYLLTFYLLTCFVLRIILLFSNHLYSEIGIAQYFNIFFLSIIENSLVFVIAAIPFFLYLIFLSNNKYQKPFGYTILAFFLLILSYLLFTNNIFKQYGSVVIDIVVYFVLLKLILFCLLLFIPKKRLQFRRILYFFILFLYVALILQNALSEYFFWGEFGVRYNFIAVDYLIYTNEVIGNIMESYPVIPMFTVLGLVALGFTYFIYSKTKNFLTNLPSFTIKIQMTVVYIALVGLALFVLPFTLNWGSKNNVYAKELGADGIHRFYEAFVNNKLSFPKFYTTIDSQKALNILKENFNWEPNTIIKDSLPEIHKNIVLISVESLSENFLSHYGNTSNITPFLDSLANESLFFTNIYAAGNRTVRGLEALTLCVPPSPGESVIKQKDNKNKFSTGLVLRNKGYKTTFLYGGYSYFDNMQSFFGGNGYTIVDRSNFKPEEISFANIWGVCDEDMAKKVIQTINHNAQSGQPLFNHWMTVSNHRPFTYPDGKVSISGQSKTRDGGVMYTDYALRQFFEMAKKQSWYNNTVFIIVADHCASSSGKVSLPLAKYRIPCMVFAPGFIKPQQVNTLMSQIDVMPTVFGLLHFSYTSNFMGQNIFDNNYQPRAFIATYQDLGFIKNNLLTILSPVRKANQYSLTLQPIEGLQPQFQYEYKESLIKNKDTSLINQAISYYQTAGILDKKKEK